MECTVFRLAVHPAAGSAVAEGASCEPEARSNAAAGQACLATPRCCHRVYSARRGNRRARARAERLFISSLAQQTASASLCAQQYQAGHVRLSGTSLSTIVRSYSSAHWQQLGHNGGSHRVALCTAPGTRSSLTASACLAGRGIRWRPAGGVRAVHQTFWQQFSNGQHP